MKIGLITMHKVLNYGSALQAFALQHSIRMLGAESEIIDYIYPKEPNYSIYTRFKFWLIDFLKGFPRKTKNRKFKSFYSNKFVLTNKQYLTPESLYLANFCYDKYLTGSDQVWNPIHIKDDLSYFFPFVNKSPKYSYASSISSGVLSEEFIHRITPLLKSYNAISVRETTSQILIESILGFKPKTVCDPTLLLSSHDWLKIAGELKYKLPDQYILVYILTYAYNPYPEILNLLREIKERLNLPIIVLDSKKRIFKNIDVTIINDAGPCDFINLVANASFVVTTSFHGTAFSLKFNKPFVSVVRDCSNFDTRMVDLLNKVNAGSRIQVYNRPLDVDLDIDYTDINRCLDSFINDSSEFLSSVVKI